MTSTRSLPKFLAILAPYGIEAVMDDPRFPGSRHQPQYNKAALAAALQVYASFHKEALKQLRTLR